MPDCPRSYNSPGGLAFVAETFVPVDHAITGIVDRVDLEGDE